MRRGFSLVEVLVTLVLLGLVLGMATLTLGRQPVRAGVRGAAEVLAEALRTARQRAQASGAPCAVALPSSDGASGYTQALYFLEGWQQPRVTRVVRLGGDFPRAYLFGGFWGGSPVPGPAPAVNGGSLSLATWAAPHPRDPTYLFLPSGAALSSEALVDGAYRLVVCDGLSWTGDTMGGRPVFRLTGVADAATVAVTPMGEVRLEPGPGLSPVSGPPAGLAALPPVLGAGPNADPDRLDIMVLPVPNPASLPPGASATVKLGGYLTLTAEASDPDGDGLSLEWQTTLVTPAGPGGAYSGQDRVAMCWDSTRSVWRAVWEWRTPPGARPGDVYELEATVRDGRGGSRSGRFGVTGRVEVLDTGRITFVSTRDGNWELYVMNYDGTDPTRLTQSPAIEFRPRWSPDGSQILYISTRTGQRELMLIERDGSQERRLTNGPALGLAGVHFADFTPDGANVIFLGESGGTHDLYMTTTLGTDPRTPSLPGAWRMTSENWTAGLGEVRGVTVHPDGQRVVVSGGPNTDVDLMEVLYGGVPTPIVTSLISLPFNQMEPAFSRDGTRLTWTSSGVWYAYNAPPGAPGSLGASSPFVSVESPAWSPDGARTTYQTGPVGARAIVTSDLVGGNAQQLTTGAYDNDDSQWTVR